MAEIIGVAWVASGAGFWVAATINNGMPRGWWSRARETGWGESLLYLIFAMIGGPLLWIATAIYAYRTRR